MNRNPMRQCGKQYGSEEEAFRSKAGQRPGAEVTGCRCGKVHVSTPKPVTGTGPDRKTREQVYRRDGYRCVCCGLSVIGQVHSIQHRKRRSQGGTNALSNLITVLGDGTRGCHHRMDSRRDPHDEAKGYTVRSGQDPAQVGVMIFSEGGSGVTRWLTDDGSYADEPLAGAA